MHRDFIHKTRESGVKVAYEYIYGEAGAFTTSWLSYQLEHMEDETWEQKFKYLQELIEFKENNTTSKYENDWNEVKAYELGINFNGYPLENMHSDIYDEILEKIPIMGREKKNVKYRVVLYEEV